MASNMQCKNCHILIVDERPENRQVLANHLSLPNYAITQASNGEEALEAIEKGLKPDLILLHVMMPKMTGYQDTRKIRETWQADELPVVLLGEQNQRADWVIGLESGANDYLTQPFEKEELLFRINIHISLCRLRGENKRLLREQEALRQENADLKILQRRQCAKANASWLNS